MPTDAKLAALLTACAHQLSDCAQVCELRAANALAPTATTTVAARIPSHIGTDGKSLPHGNFRAVFV